MTVDLESIALAVLPPGAAVGIALFFMKKWISDVDFKMRDVASAVLKIEKDLAHSKGKAEGEKESIWNKLETNARKTNKLMESNEKIWHALSKISNVNNRTSDRILGDD